MKVPWNEGLTKPAGLAFRPHHLSYPTAQKANAGCSTAFIENTKLRHHEETIRSDFRSFKNALQLLMHRENKTASGKDFPRPDFRSHWITFVWRSALFTATEIHIFGLSSIRLFPFKCESSISFNVTLEARHILLPPRNWIDGNLLAIRPNVSSSYLVVSLFHA